MTAQDILQIRLIALQQANQPYLSGDLLDHAERIYKWLSKDVLAEEEYRIVNRERKKHQPMEIAQSGTLTPFGENSVGDAF